MKMANKVKQRKIYGDPFSFDSFETWIWRKYDTDIVVDISKYIEDNKDCLFFIGTDSQTYTKNRTCVFTTVLIAYRRGHGGRIIRYTDKRGAVPFSALSAKLMVETQRSIELCKFVENKLLELSDGDCDYTKNLVGISIDVNSDELKGESAKYMEALVGMVVSYGYTAFVKPDAWAASRVADARC